MLMKARQKEATKARSEDKIENEEGEDDRQPG